jgi:hypothetical protein
VLERKVASILYQAISQWSFRHQADSQPGIKELKESEAAAHPLNLDLPVKPF